MIKCCGGSLVDKNAVTFFDVRISFTIRHYNLIYDKTLITM